MLEKRETRFRFLFFGWIMVVSVSLVVFKSIPFGEWFFCFVLALMLAFIFLIMKREAENEVNGIFVYKKRNASIVYTKIAAYIKEPFYATVFHYENPVLKFPDKFWKNIRVDPEGLIISFVTDITLLTDHKLLAVISKGDQITFSKNKIVVDSVKGSKYEVTLKREY